MCCRMLALAPEDDACRGGLALSSIVGAEVDAGSAPERKLLLLSSMLCHVHNCVSAFARMDEASEHAWASE